MKATTTNAIKTLAVRALMTALLLLVAGTASAYIVFLKNGEQINTREAPEVVGEKAILVLPSGTQTSIDASEIDFEKTAEVNKITLGNARIIEGRETRLLEKDTDELKQKTFSDLVSERKMGLSLPETSTPPPPEEAVAGAEAEALPRTSAGYVDLLALERATYRQDAIVTELQQYLKGQGLGDVSIHRGSEPTRALLEINANSEASVFKALKISANALIQARQRFPDELRALELLMVTSTRSRAGQFLLTSELATLLASGELEPAAFFIRYVEF